MMLNNYMGTFIVVILEVIFIYKISNFFLKKMNNKPKQKLADFSFENKFNSSTDVKTRPFAFQNTLTYIDENGYVRFSDSDILYHRWMMKKIKQRDLDFEEVVHHIDGNKLNNNPKNLRLFANQDQHNKHHLNQLKYSGTWYDDIPEYKDYTNYHSFAK